MSTDRTDQLRAALWRAVAKTLGNHPHLSEAERLAALRAAEQTDSMITNRAELSQLLAGLDTTTKPPR